MTVRLCVRGCLCVCVSSEWKSKLEMCKDWVSERGKTLLSRSLSPSRRTGFGSECIVKQNDCFFFLRLMHRDTYCLLQNQTFRNFSDQQFFPKITYFTLCPSQQCSEIHLAVMFTCIFFSQSNTQIYTRYIYNLFHINQFTFLHLVLQQMQNQLQWLFCN